MSVASLRSMAGESMTVPAKGGKGLIQQSARSSSISEREPSAATPASVSRRQRRQKRLHQCRVAGPVDVPRLEMACAREPLEGDEGGVELLQPDADRDRHPGVVISVSDECGDLEPAGFIEVAGGGPFDT